MSNIRILFAACALLMAFPCLRAQDSMPQLISTTGGGGGGGAASAKTWDNASPAALKKAADAGDPDACYELGNRYLSGDKDFPKNATRAMLCFEDAARKGNRDAAFRLGKMYSDGALIPRDYAQAIKYYTAAARAGDAIAQHNLGAMYASGRGVKTDYAEGLAWLITAARRAPEAADSEKKLRAFLASEKHPDLIAAGEARARELAQELAGAKATEVTEATQATGATQATEKAGAAISPIKIVPVKTEPIKIAPPQMTLPPIDSMVPTTGTN